MSTERLDWEAAADLPTANIRLKRRFEIIDRGLRLTATVPAVAAGAVVITAGQTLLVVDASAGDVAYTLPVAATVAGAVLRAKVTGGYALILTPASGETIDGQTDIETYDALTLVAVAGQGYTEL